MMSKLLPKVKPRSLFELTHPPMKSPRLLFPALAMASALACTHATGADSKPEETAVFDRLFQMEKPVTPKRGVHLDLKGLPPTPERFVELLKLFSAARYNVVLIEWEDSFPWTVDPRFRSPTAYTPEDIHRFTEIAAKLGIELIPLVQCLGHMETPLSVPGYENLREVPDNSSGLNPLAPGARDLVQRMVDDVLKLMPEVKHFHLGGDEARTLGQSAACLDYIKEHGKGALYLQHVGPIMDHLISLNIRPILWHDMMIEWDDAALDALAKKCDLMVWGYAGDPDTTTGHFNTKYIQRFHDHGVVLWGATAYKGCEGETRERHTADRPVISARVENAEAWSRIAPRFDFTGVIATGWSRWSVDTLQCDPIDAALDSLVMVGVILHDGKAPQGGIDACIDALAGRHEKERFEACKKSMERLTDLRQRGWLQVQRVREQIVLGKIDPCRTSARSKVQGLKGLDQLAGIVRESERVSAEVKRSFDGLVAAVWIEEYLATRLNPFREELSALSASVQAEK